MMINSNDYGCISTLDKFKGMSKINILVFLVIPRLNVSLRIEKNESSLKL